MQRRLSFFLSLFLSLRFFSLPFYVLCISHFFFPFLDSHPEIDCYRRKHAAPNSRPNPRSIKHVNEGMTCYSNKTR
ncbi:hypothetical protein HDV57DRAFT_146471 [Trichoderma longibrachiatum]